MDADWLKEHVGSALSNALLDLSRNQAQDPVEFLGKHLLHHVDCKREELRTKALAGKVQARLAEEQKVAEEEETTRVENEETQQAKLETMQRDMEAIRRPGQVLFHELKHGNESNVGVCDALQGLEKCKIQDVMEFVEKHTSAHCVYVGKRQPDGSIKFVASNDPTIVGQTLVDEQNEDGESNVLPFQVFQKPPTDEEEEQQQEEEEGEEGEGSGSKESEKAEKEKPLPQFVVVENVLRDNKVPFFGRIPTLGSFAAVHVPYLSSIHESAIPEDGGLIVEEEQEQEVVEAEEGAEEGEKAETKEGEEAGDENTGDQDSPAGEEKECETTKPKRWRANQIEGAYLICFDTMGKAPFQIGFVEEEVELVRRAAQVLSEALTETEDAKYQAEMTLRDSLQALASENREKYTAELAQYEERCEALIKEKMDAYENAAAPTGEEGEQAAEGEQQQEEEQEGKQEGGEEETKEEAAVPVSEEQKAVDKATISLNVAKETIGQWWVSHLRTQKKMCIEPPAEIQSALNKFIRLFSEDHAANDQAWEDLKRADVDAMAELINNFSVEQNCGIDEEKAKAFVEEIAAIQPSEESPAWIDALVLLSNKSLELLLAEFAHQAYIAELKAQEEAARAEAEAEAAAAAAAAAEAAEAENEEE